MATVFLEARACSALMACAEAHPHLAAQVLQKWEASGFGNNDIRELLEVPYLLPCRIHNAHTHMHMSESDISDDSLFP